jgi:hypothetical protein
MFVVASIADNQLRQTFLCSTMGEAVDIATALVMEQQDTDSEQEVKKELEIDGWYAPSKVSDWTVCIGLPEGE